ncbi:MAG TPA: hypothetical protein PKC39_07715 [Ferruginibacter sp.]|nr:hypothetical protein [Ferruginibacter sp.]HMP20831.1 hypothetical protein [Ferruginibacter sp.]
MKQLLFVLVAASLFTACNNAPKDDAATATPDATTAKPEPPALPFTPSYSASFEMGNPAYAAMIVQGSWKDWETNNLDNMKNWIADTIVAFHSDNVTVQGADSLIARWKRGRANYTSVIDTIHAVLPVYSTDQKENWVLVWAKEVNTNSKGITETVELMESWRINKDGKADMLLQYDRQARKK